MTRGYRTDGTKLGFQMSSIPWNKGKKSPSCGNNKKGKKLTKLHRLKIGIGLKNSKVKRILSNDILYSSFHNYIRRNFGAASKCTNSKCPKVSKNYQWANRIGRNLSHEKDDYVELCVSCHKLYDSDKLKINTI